MNRFIALVWNHRSDIASKDAGDIVTTLRGRCGEWQCSKEAPGLFVLEALHRSGAEGGLIVGENVAFVGAVFAGRGRASASDLSETALIASRGADAFARVWGRYVCFLRDVNNACVFVARDPSGALPCYVARRGNAFAFFSNGEDAELIGLEDGSIDWGYVALRLANNRATSERTAVAGVVELRPGAVARVGQSRLSIEQIWRPESIAQDMLEGREAKSLLRDALETVCAGWSQRAPRMGLRLSGGLDSSVVLACLPNPASVFAINFATPSGEGDERAYARAAAKWAGVSLMEVRRDPCRVDLQAAVRTKPTLNPPLWLADGETDEVEAAFAAEHGLAVILSGRGGDNVFFRTLRDDVLIDLLLTRGPGLRFWRRCWSHAAETGAPFLGSALGACRQALARTPPSAAQYPMYLTEKVIDLLPDAEERTPSLPPGKRLHIALIEDRLNYFDWRAHADYIYPLVSQPVIEACLRLPTFVLSPGGRDRGLVRDLFSARIAPLVLQRRSKGQTSGYLAEILLGQLQFIRGYLLDGALEGHGLVRSQVLSAMLSEAGVLRDSSILPRIVGLLSVEAWLRNLPKGLSAR